MPDLLQMALSASPNFRVGQNRPIDKSSFQLNDGTPMVGPDALLAPPAHTTQMVVNPSTRVYSYRFDEAQRDNFVAARAMRRDAFINSLLEERLLPTVNRKWELEIDNDKDPFQKEVREGLTQVVKAIPDFVAFKREALEGTWYGRAGIQWAYSKLADVNNHWGLSRWDPIHGDSVQFTFDGIPAILLDSLAVGWYASHGAVWGPHGDLRSTDRGGTALVLQRPYWRERFAIYTQWRRKADYFEGELAGSVQGLGLRGLVYWQYVVRTDALTWMLAYMQAVGQMDLLVFNYPAGNDAAKQNQEMNARKIMGKATIVCPRDPKSNFPAVEQIPMNEAGLKALKELVADYFDRHIERLIVGQSMSSGADNDSGLGGTGRSEFAKETKSEILEYDTVRLDEVLTRDLVMPLKRFNYPNAKFPVRFKSVMPDLEKSERVKNGQLLIQSGVPIKVDQFREAAGYSRPEDGDETVGGQPMGPDGQPLPLGGMPNGQQPLPQNPMMGGQPMPGMPNGQQPTGSPQPTPSPQSQPSKAIGAKPGGDSSIAGSPQPQQPNAMPITRQPWSPKFVAPAATDFSAAGGMGSPGGSNTYIPKFGGNPDARPMTTSFIRYDMTHRRDGEVWQGPSGHWFTLKGNHVTPAPAPNATQPTTRQPKTEQPIAQQPTPQQPQQSHVNQQTQPSQSASPTNRQQSSPANGQPSSQQQSSPSTFNPPNPRDLESANDLRRLHPGVSVRRDSTGQEWVVKGRTGRGKQVANESLAASLSQHANIPVAPVYHVKLHGQDNAVVAPVKGTSLVNMSPEQRRAAMANVPRQQLDDHALFDYIIGSADPNLGNFMVGEDGNLIGIDKEQSLGLGMGQRARYQIPPMLSDAVPPGQSASDYQFDSQSIANMIDASDRIANDLEQKGKKSEAAGVRRRKSVLESFAGNPVTAGQLDAAGKLLDKQPSSGVFGKLRKLFGG